MNDEQTLLSVPFAVEMPLDLMPSHLSTLVFKSHIQQVLSHTCVLTFFPYISSSGFKVSDLTLKSLIHFELMFFKLRNDMDGSIPCESILQNISINSVPTASFSELWFKSHLGQKGVLCGLCLQVSE